MKKFIIASILSLFLLIFLLKLSKNQVNQEPELKVISEIVLNQDDELQLFYKTKTEPDYKEENSVKLVVEGNSKPQIVEFVIPNNPELTGIRLDLGNYRNQESIKIYSIGIVIDPDTKGFLSVQNDLVANEFLVPNGKQFLPKIVGDPYDPYLLSKENFSVIFNSIKSTQPKHYNKLGVLLSLLFSASLFLFVYHLPYKFSNDAIVQNGYIAIFFGIIILPLFSKLFNIDYKDSNLEKRVLNEMPELKLSPNFATEFESYYNDNFGLRNLLVAWSSKLKIDVFNSSPKVEKVQLGKNEFLFYNDTSEHIYDSYSHSDIFDEEKFNKKYDRLKQQRSFCKANDIALIWAILPNKATIYPENLPRTMQFQVPDNKSLAQQYADFFADKDLEVYNVTDDLLKQKKNHDLYQKFDSHWNSFGAYFAYESLLNHYYNILQSKPYGLNDFNISYEEIQSGDLTEMLGIKQVKNYSDSNPVFVPKNERLKFETEILENGKIKKTTNPNAPSDKKLVVFRDSFTTLLMQFLSLNFQEVVYVSSDFDENLILAEKPDVVMVLKIERLIKFF